MTTPTHEFPLRHPDRPLLVKKNETPRSAKGTLDSKRYAAATHAAALDWVGEPGVIRDARILLVDDVLTSGSQLQHVARRLTTYGAAEVRGLVLARAPWG
ncbi:ComF family protein [Streptomyces atratus]